MVNWTDIEAALMRQFGFCRATFQKEIGGISSRNALFVADSHQFVVKQYRDMAAESIQRIEAVTAFLSQHSLPVVQAVPTRNGLRYFEYNGNFFSLFPQICGHTLHENSLTPASLESAGECLVTLHRVTDKVPPFLHKLLSRQIQTLPLREQAISEGNHLLQYISRESLGPLLDATTRKLIATKMRIIADSPKSNDAFCLPNEHFIHGDFHNENLLFGPGYEVKCILDFERSRYGHRVEDVISFINLACLNTGYGEMNIFKARTFLKAYTTQYPLSAFEMFSGFHHYFYTFTHTFFLESQLYLAKQRQLTPYIQRDLRRLQYMEQNLHELVSALLK